MKLQTGLNPYGLTYHLGLQGMGTPRANPHGAGLEGFFALTLELGAKVMELWEGWLKQMSYADLAALRDRLDGHGLARVVSSGLQSGDMALLIRAALALNARHIRFALTPVLCGDRAATDWPAMVASVHDKLGRYAAMAEAAGLVILIENHQDFTSHELVALCQRYGEVVRIVYDTGNSFPVGEAPLDFTEVIAPYVRHVHLKDYNAQATDEGFRLVRCAIGDGAVPFAQLFDILAKHNDTMTCVLEPGALEARHVRLFTPGWWQGYAPRSAASLAACLLATRQNPLPEGADWRTPWERGEDHLLEAYELAMIRRSALNMKSLGLM